MAAGGEGFKYSGGPSRNDLAWHVAIALRPSRGCGALIVAVATLGALALRASELPGPARAGLGAWLFVAALRAFRRHALATPRRVVRLSVDLAGRVEIERANGDRASGRLQPGSFVAPFLTLVRWRPEGARLSRTLLVAPDAVPAAAFRRLRVLLRWR